MNLQKKIPHAILISVTLGPKNQKETTQCIIFHLGTDAVENKMATFCHDEHQKVESKTSSLIVVLKTFETNEIYGIHGKYYSGK